MKNLDRNKTYTTVGAKKEHVKHLFAWLVLNDEDWKKQDEDFLISGTRISYDRIHNTWQYEPFKKTQYTPISELFEEEPKKVRCLYPFRGITVGEVYEIVCIDEWDFTLIEDDGTEQDYAIEHLDGKHFKYVEEEWKFHCVENYQNNIEVVWRKGEEFKRTMYRENATVTQTELETIAKSLR